MVSLCPNEALQQIAASVSSGLYVYYSSNQTHTAGQSGCYAGPSSWQQVLTQRGRQAKPC